MCSYKKPKIPQAPVAPEPEVEATPLQAVYTSINRRLMGEERLRRTARGGFVGGAGISTPPVLLRPMGSNYQARPSLLGS